MTDQSLIIAVAKLDGWTWKQENETQFLFSHASSTFVSHDRQFVSSMIHCITMLPHYLTSRDAIIPVIEKALTKDVQWFNFFLNLGKECRERFPIQADPLINYKLVLLATARQLSIALVKATGKWEK